MLLKHIFSNINISNLLTHIKKYFNNNHFLYIEETIQKFLACLIDKAFIVYQCPLCGSTHKSKNQRVHKIDRYSKKYFTNSDILHYGLITVIHTFGRDLKWNPHIHAIVTLGGFNRNYKYLNKKYFHVNSIAGQWKKLVIDIVKSGNYENKNLKKKAQIIASSLYKKDMRFLFDIAKNDLNNNVSAIKYIGRYLSRAPIAEYKILDFSDDKVTFYYEDLSNNKEKVENYYGSRKISF